jgi:hypothetical protein
MGFDRLFFAVLAATSLAACSSNGALGGLNGPCERENQCVAGLSCVGGVCTPPVERAMDAGGASRDASAPDSEGSD